VKLRRRRPSYRKTTSAEQHPSPAQEKRDRYRTGKRKPHVLCNDGEENRPGRRYQRRQHDEPHDEFSPHALLSSRPHSKHLAAPTENHDHWRNRGSQGLNPGRQECQPPRDEALSRCNHEPEYGGCVRQQTDRERFTTREPTPELGSRQIRQVIDLDHADQNRKRAVIDDGGRASEGHGLLSAKLLLWPKSAAASNRSSIQAAVLNYVWPGADVGYVSTQPHRNIQAARRYRVAPWTIRILIPFVAVLAINVLIHNAAAAFIPVPIVLAAAWICAAEWCGLLVTKDGIESRMTRRENRFSYRWSDIDAFELFDGRTQVAIVMRLRDGSSKVLPSTRAWGWDKPRVEQIHTALLREQAAAKQLAA
jgi:hypothetical protein